MELFESHKGHNCFLRTRKINVWISSTGIHINQMRKTLMIILYMTFSLSVWSQNNPFELSAAECGAIENVDQRNDMGVTLTETEESFIDSDSIIIVPVVVHIRHHYDYANVDSEEIKEAIKDLNERFSLTNKDTLHIHPEFRKRMGNPRIEFRLATIDPDGNRTSGITRLLTTNNCSSIPSLSSFWNPNKYLNIIFTYSGDSAFGQASYPSDEDMLRGSGIVVSSRVFIQHSILKYDFKTVLAHEAGHYLGLSHIWGHTNDPSPSNGCQIDDSDRDRLVSDTPRQLKATTSYPGFSSSSGKCPNFPHFSCSNEVTGDNYNNYMDYSCCRSMFTQNQARRMRTIISTHRSELISPENLIATGTDDVSYHQNYNLPPKASLAYDNDRDSAWVIVTDHIHFKGYYDNTLPDTWEWTFNGGIPEKSYDRNPKVTFPKTGTYQVELIVSNAHGSDTLTENLKIFVLPKNDYYGEHLVEDFENSVIGKDILDWSWNYQSRWKNGIIDYVGNKVAYRQAPNSLCPNGIDYLHLPPLSLKGKKNHTLKFRTALEGFEGNFGVKGSFWVYGGTSHDFREHTLLLRLTDGAMITTLNFSGINQPGDDSDWKHHSIPIPAQYKDAENFYLSFITNHTGGSSFFLDDITIEEQNPTSTSPTFALKEFVYPNPVTDFLHVSVSSDHDKNFTLFDSFGHEVERGQLSQKIDVSHLPAGLYFIYIADKTRSCVISQKFVKIN